MYDKVAIITLIWRRAKYYFTCISNVWYLIIVPNMNKFTTFFSVISNMKKIHAAIIEECARTDGLTDRLSD